MRITRNPRNDVDVKRLLEIFPDLMADGRRILHTQLEEALTMSRVASRYKTVVRRWRNVVLAERGVYLDGMLAEGQGLVALTPDEMVRFGNRQVRTAGRRLKKALIVLALPDDSALSEDSRRYRQRLLLATEQIAATHRAALRDLGKTLAPMKQLPRAAEG